jgi:flagellar basal body-associated protein FliL
VLILGLCALLLPAAGVATLDALDLYDFDGSPARHGSKGLRARPPGPAPEWIEPLNFVAQSGDGQLVSLQVSIDAPDSSTRRTIAAETAQLTILLKLQVGTMMAAQLRSPDGIARLSKRMLNALRDHLGDDSEDEIVQVRQVAIGNLVVRKP